MAEEKSPSKTGPNDVDIEIGELKSPAKNRYDDSPVLPPEKQVVEATRRPSKIPILFERSARSWWNPRFDSLALERQHQKSSIPQTQKRFQFALGYIILSCIVWCIFFGVRRDLRWVEFLIGSIVLIVIMAVVLVFSFQNLYRRFILHTSVAVALILCLFDLLSYSFQEPALSPIGTFAGSIEILIMMYTFIPLPLYVCAGAGILYSLTFELLSGCLTGMGDPRFVICRALLHFCIHIVGVHIFIMSEVRKRSTFLKVGQSLLLRRDLQTEKQVKHNMIHSLMPPKVAEEIMKSRENDRDRDAEEEEARGGGKRRRSSQAPERGKMNFRSFHMSQMDRVSILFADIVGFTKMSSNKSAEHLVSLLNDLFGRFDDICTRNNCEKISTLGDCYYCVSGCPEPRTDHALSCVEMGLAMCIAIKEFDEEHKEEVNMRVGVHTGTVLCGIVGNRRFKFDVWSHDVTLANTMESEGRPGRVHISDCTYQFIDKDYVVEPGEEVDGRFVGFFCASTVKFLSFKTFTCSNYLAFHY